MVGITLGALVLSEVVDARLVLGAALILSGIAVVTLKRRPRAQLAAVPAPAAQTE
jgi:drug/metabolite transporter (DMT)-like permease